MKKTVAVLSFALLLCGGSAQADEHRYRSLVERARAAAGVSAPALKTHKAAARRTATVGVVEYTRGAATLQGSQRAPQIIGRGAKFNRNDVITTGKKSFAVLRLSDGTRMTLRPNSKFAVEEFNPALTDKASATLRLFKGGLRAVTGFISKYNRNGYTMRTPVATIGVRGTEFDARLCGQDCEAERKKLRRVDLAKPRAIGRVAFMRGQMAARNKDGHERKVRRGEPVYEGDTLLSGRSSFGVIAFRDKSRITLQPQSQFKVDKFSFNEAKPDKNIALMSLLRGGLRAVTGKIGKFKRKNYQMRTPVATIGVRGTGYDLQCQGGCIALDGAYYAPHEPTLIDRVLDMVSRPAYADSPAGDGLFASVWSGAIQIQQANSSQDLLAGQFAFIPDSIHPVQMLQLPEVPAFIRNNTAPRPDEVEIDEDALFAEVDQQNAAPGLYVSVYEGVVTMDGEGESVDIAAGEAAFTADDAVTPVRLLEQPAFQVQDWIPNPANITDINILDEQGQQTLECEII